MSPAEVAKLKDHIAKTKPKLGALVKGEQFAPKRLDIACGQNKTPGFKGIDLSGDADITHDLFSFPWPIKTSSVSEIACNHFVEHIPHYRPEWNGVDGWWLFFDELWRICKKDATLTFVHPYVKSTRAFWDPTHVRFIHEVTWNYLNRDWRVAQGLDHYPVSCHFEVVTVMGTGIPDAIQARNPEYQEMARNHFWDVIPDLQVTLRAVK